MANFSAVPHVDAYLAEFCGTTLLIFLGCGACANNNLYSTLGYGMGYVGIAASWGIAVMVAAYIFFWDSGSYFNPAVAIGFAIANSRETPINVGQLFGFIGCQLAGSIFGAFLVWLLYKNHFDLAESKATIGDCFFTSPAIWDPLFNFLSEVMITFMLVFVLIGIGQSVKEDTTFESIRIIVVGGTIMVAILSTGGTTGCCMNSVRDLGPRLVHWVVPIQGKGISHWNYAWVPVFGPLVGGALAGCIGGVVFRRF
jgi:glycerol uptake facilitator protein